MADTGSHCSECKDRIHCFQIGGFAPVIRLVLVWSRTYILVYQNIIQSIPREGWWTSLFDFCRFDTCKNGQHHPHSFLARSDAISVIACGWTKTDVMSIKMDFENGKWKGKVKRVNPLTDLDSIFLLLLKITGVDTKLHVLDDDRATSTIDEDSVGFNS